MRVKACSGEVQMFKNFGLDVFLNPSFKMMTSLINIARTTDSTSKFLYQERF